MVEEGNERGRRWNSALKSNSNGLSPVGVTTTEVPSPLHP